MFSKFNEEAQKVLNDAKKEMIKLKHPYVGSEHLLLAILLDKNNSVTKHMAKYNVDYNSFRNEIIKIIGLGNETNNWFLFTPLLKNIIEVAVINSKENNVDVTIECLFVALLEEGEGVATRILLGMGINIDKLYEDFSAKMVIKKNKSKKKLIIDEYGYDVNKQVLNNEIDPVIGRDEEIIRIIEILCRRTKNNPLLLGEAGVGKTAIVEELSRRIVNNQVPEKLKNKRIISLSMASLVAGTKYRGEFEERITKMLKEVESNSDIIIFIDEIHTLVGAGGAEGAIDASNILKPVLARGKIKLIGATTTMEYKKFIEDDRALDRRFQPVIINEPKNEKLMQIILGIKPIYEKYHNVILSNKIIELIIYYSNKYIHNRKQPDKAIDLMDEVCAKVSTLKSKNEEKKEKLLFRINEIKKEKNNAIVIGEFDKARNCTEEEKIVEDKINKLDLKISKQNNTKEVTIDDLAKVIGIKFNVKKEDILLQEKIDYKNLEEKFNNVIIGQKSAISHIISIYKAQRIECLKDNKPLSILLAGPTGVGKTLLAKTYNDILGNGNKLIRLDMSEYKEEYTISKIIGSPPGYVGYDSKNSFLDQIKANPNAIILMDELEKAHPSVLNLFLQMFDEGIIKNSFGEEISLKNNTIIMTTNVTNVNEQIGFQKSAINEYDTLKKNFSIEILNRIKYVVPLDSLSYDEIKCIIIKYLKKNNIKIKRMESLIEDIIEKSEYKMFGARKIENVIRIKFQELNENGNLTLSCL